MSLIYHEITQVSIRITKCRHQIIKKQNNHQLSTLFGSLRGKQRFFLKKDIRDGTELPCNLIMYDDKIILT